MPAERTKSTALLLVIAVFVLGVAVGGLGMYAARGRVFGAPAAHTPMTPEKARARRVADLTEKLNLNPDQAKQLDGILTQIHSQYVNIHDQENALREQESKQGRDQIRAILTPDQVAKFNDYLQKMDEERKKRASGQ